MNLFNDYSMDECIDRKKVMSKLKSFEKDGKIEYIVDQQNDTFRLTDLDLEDDDIEDLIRLFDQNDVFPYMDYNEEEDGGEEGDDYYDEGEDDY